MTVGVKCFLKDSLTRSTCVCKDSFALGTSKKEFILSFTFRALKPILASASFAAALTAGTPGKAQDYPVDCAILLCLAGGWPASEACTDAYGEFIDRITPWPVEPPLQIWRCPMGASFEKDADRTPMERLRKAFSLLRTPSQSIPIDASGSRLASSEAAPALFRRERGGTADSLPDDFVAQVADDFINEDGSADMDISSPVYDFVRSIKVYMIRGFQFGNEDNCNRRANVRLGTYGTQGEYRWQSAELDDVPSIYAPPRSWGRNCPLMRLRTVLVEWHDHEGAYGWERVDY